MTRVNGDGFSIFATSPIPFPVPHSVPRGGLREIGGSDNIDA